MWETGEESKKISIDLINQWDGAGGGRLHIWISPRSVGGCSLDLFQWTVKTARDYGVGITTHWSEVKNNVEYTLSEFGLRPVMFAEKIGMLGPDVTFAHGIYLDEVEIDLLAKTRTNIAHCPICNSKLAMGIAKVPQMLRAGVNVALGNDGMGVNNTADLFREMRAMVLLHRVTQGDPLFPTAAEAIEMATINGAKAMMADRVVGSLEIGKRADIILINMHQPHLVPLHDLVSPLVWAVNGGDVDTAIIDGNIVMQNRKVLTLDEEKVVVDAEKFRHKILHQAGVVPQHVWPIL
jgi:cytosine/adenosine deaminase-related metal-dependent hydrolase